MHKHTHTIGSYSCSCFVWRACEPGLSKVMKSHSLEWAIWQLRRGKERALADRGINSLPSLCVFMRITTYLIMNGGMMVRVRHATLSWSAHTELPPSQPPPPRPAPKQPHLTLTACHYRISIRTFHKKSYRRYQSVIHSIDEKFYSCV